MNFLEMMLNKMQEELEKEKIVAREMTTEEKQELTGFRDKEKKIEKMIKALDAEIDLYKANLKKYLLENDISEEWMPDLEAGVFYKLEKLKG